MKVFMSVENLIASIKIIFQIFINILIQILKNGNEETIKLLLNSGKYNVEFLLENIHPDKTYLLLDYINY